MKLTTLISGLAATVLFISASKADARVCLQHEQAAFWTAYLVATNANSSSEAADAARQEMANLKLICTVYNPEALLAQVRERNM